MTAGLVAGQFLMYDGIKHGAWVCEVLWMVLLICGLVALGAPPGLEIHKEAKEEGAR